MAAKKKAKAKTMKTVNVSTLRRYMRSILTKAQKEPILVVRGNHADPVPLVVISRAPDA